MLARMEPGQLRVGDRLDLKLTYDDYAAMPDDGRRYQLIEGDLEVTPAPSLAHQRVSRNLGLALADHVRRRRLGSVFYAPTDVILDERTVLQPDILFVSRQRSRILSERGVEGAPDLVVEVLSPATRRFDRASKLRLYARAGVSECWLVDPDAATVEVLALREGTYMVAESLGPAGVIKSTQLPGLEVDLGEVFAPDP